MDVTRNVATSVAAAAIASAFVSAATACGGMVADDPSPRAFQDAASGETSSTVDAAAHDGAAPLDGTAPLDGVATLDGTGSVDAPFIPDVVVSSDASSADDAIDAVDAPDAPPADAGCGPPPACGVGPKGTVTLPLAQYPALESLDNGVLVQDSRYQDPVCFQDQIIVIQTAPNQFAALSGSSTFLCCNLETQNDELVDVCNGTAFGFDGVPVSGGSGLQPLQTLAACADTCAVYVALP